MSSGSRLPGRTCLAGVSNACLKTTDFAEMFDRFQELLRGNGHVYWLFSEGKWQGGDSPRDRRESRTDWKE